MQFMNVLLINLLFHCQLWVNWQGTASSTRYLSVALLFWNEGLDSCVIKLSLRGQKAWNDVFSGKSIPCILSNLNPPLNYRVVGIILLIYNIVPVNIQYHIRWFTYKFFKFLSISENMKKLMTLSPTLPFVPSSSFL